MASACTNSLGSSGHEGPRSALQPTRARADTIYIEQRKHHYVRLLAAGRLLMLMTTTHLFVGKYMS
jgi:hypothetical protein